MIPPLYAPVDGHHLRRCRRPDRILAHFLHRSPHPGWTRPRVHRHARHQFRDRNSTGLHSVSRRLFPPAPLVLLQQFPSDPTSRQIWLVLGAAFLPAAIVGLATHSWIEAHL